MKPTVEWNERVQLIVSDVDETVADLYLEAPEATVKELENLLAEGKGIFFISGQSIGSIFDRVVSRVSPELRPRVLIGHCSGAEVYGFEESGAPSRKPFYSLYEESISDSQKEAWRKVVCQLCADFGLDVHPPMPIDDFRMAAGDEPLAAMVEDRGPQITVEFANGHAIPATRARELGLSPESSPDGGTYDLRRPFLDAAQTALDRAGLPVEARAAGVFAVDFVLQGVSKTTAVEYVLSKR